MTTRTDDYDEILRVIQLYVDGFCGGDGGIAKYKEAFHEDAGFFCVEPDGNLDACRMISERFADWAHEDGHKVTGRIVSLTQMGDAAGVVLLFDEDWIDFLQLVRIDGVWKITNKTATHSSR